ncbi:MAG: adenylate/guanylate cyclase domain-containing protein [candidate division WOR-3 bacterium]
MLNCPECKNTLPDKANFCPYCGKILSYEKTLPLEELSLTFLRADLSGFTGLSENITAEDAMNFLNNLFGSFYKIIEKYKGILYQVIGDEVVGIFGLSRESGYAPHLSIIAIEEIMKKVKECNKLFPYIKECKIKCGLEMAPASIYNIKGDLRNSIIITDGFAKSLVLQKNAESNVVLIGESLYQATRSFFEYEEYGEVIENYISVRAYKLKLR